MLDSRNYAQDSVNEGPEQARGMEAQSNLDPGQLLNEGRSLDLYDRKSDAVPTSLGLPSAADLLGDDSTLLAVGRPGVPVPTREIDKLDKDKPIFRLPPPTVGTGS